MRMRKLGKGQTVVFCVPEEIRSRIIERTSKSSSERIAVTDILRWAITETWTDIRRSMPLWAVQGRRFEHHNELWQQAHENGKTSLSKQSAEAFLESEAQSVEDRYRPNAGASVEKMLAAFGSDNAALVRIQQRCLDFENLQFNSATLQEEQERELSPEIEQERQVQAPPPAKAREHRVHDDVCSFIDTGILAESSPAYGKAFLTLANTSARNYVDLSELASSHGPDLYVTFDFANTIVPSNFTAKEQYDSFLRPVQWILTASTCDIVTRMLIISPHEAQELLPRVQKGSKVTLHLYSPRCNTGFRSLDRLDFITLGGRSGPPTFSIHPRLICQLNLFSGQLYINSYDDLKWMCEYLGIAVDTAKDGWKIAADGFIVEDEHGKVGGPGSALTKSPVKFLRTLAAIRRDGEGIARTDMGILLEGRVLQASHFDR
nr:hypothetical protein CFP56_00328 [Quercus suber]